FVVVASSFYGAIAHRVPSAPVGSRAFRETVAPLNQPSGTVSPEIRAAAREASIDAFHLAMLVAAGLLVTGAAVNAIGIRNPAPSGRRLGPFAEQHPSESGAHAPVGPVRVARDELTKEVTPAEV